MRLMRSSISTLAIVALVVPAAALQAQTQAAVPAASDPTALIKQAREAQNKGRLDEAATAYRAAVGKDPKVYEAHLGLGQVLDLQGHYADARKHFEHAIELATPDQKIGARSNMATSYAFERKAADAAKYYQKNFDELIAAGRLDRAADTANALGRAYLESGDTTNAEGWYRTGYETSKKLEKAMTEDIDLWDMRWHHALGRIAARKGRSAEARQHAQHVKEIVDRGRLDKDQIANYPYLLGYIAFYSRDYDTAVAELLKGSQDDPFVLGLLAQAYEKKNDDAKAKEYYAKVLEQRGHALQHAFMRPLARKKIPKL